MEQIQEKKFVCKFCNKRFPCGKSLGGHIRTHMQNQNSSVEAEAKGGAELSINELLSRSNIRNVKRVAEFEPGGCNNQSATYGLRENPKRTKRFSDSGKTSLIKEMICKECGKGFQSLKALCGHMACHSEKEKVFQKFEETHSGNGEKQKLIMDSQSDTETSTPSRRRRSKRIRYKTIGVYSNNSVSLANGSEIEQEQEDLAMCLMMLSRDSSGGGCKKGLNSLGDSSDNNSVVLEAKSSSIDVKITIKNDMKYVSNDGEFVKMKNQRETKLKSVESDASSENSDSGYFRYGPKKVESDVSVDGFLKNVEFKKQKMESGSGFDDFDAKLGRKCLSKSKCVETEFPKNLVNEVGENHADRAVTKYDLRRIGKNDSYNPDYFCNNSAKGSKYECLTCNKTFDSHRALGGHRASHTKVSDCTESIHENGEDNLANDSSVPVPMIDHSKVTKSSYRKSLNATATHGLSGNGEKRLGSKKNKGHECPFCFKVFKSGQALGGHKRSHFVGGSEDRTLVIKQNSPDQMAALIDLNLPAPVEEDTMGNVGFMPW